MATIAILGTFDTKGEEHAFIAELIKEKGHETLMIDVGTGGEPTITPDVSRYEVAAATGLQLQRLIEAKDRGQCVVEMSKAAPVYLSKLVDQKKIDGVISLGGGGGTALGTAAMRALPLGFPKIMVSTLASGNTEHYLGTSDICMMPSIVDVAGLNSISKIIFSRAANAICGMVEMKIDDEVEKPLIVASMFGNTTECINHAKPIFEEAGYEFMVFHATGTGGKTMESIIESGRVAGVFDVTTTELADELLGGTLSAGPNRLDAMTKQNIPAIVGPGCLDMANFGERETLPEKFEERTIYIHNPQVTLVRTNADENSALGELLAKKANANKAPVAIMLPLKGISVICQEGQPFYDAKADTALFDSIHKHSQKDIFEFNTDINSKEFSEACAHKLLELINTQKKQQDNKMVRHFGVFKFHPEVSTDEINQCFEQMKSMVGKIEGLLSLESGAYQSDEGLDAGFTHGFIMTFDSFESRDKYLPHQIHEEVKEFVVPKLADVIVFDFEVQKELAGIS
ncbi:MAG: Tm-1-like ATP-binding domain-containing protein [Lentisphaeraceae bacterium]|nr:Tm-1-like ATP-binding domain-containing protein [Lentisphaeraceae bacterium]